MWIFRKCATIILLVSLATPGISSQLANDNLEFLSILVDSLIQDTAGGIFLQVDGSLQISSLEANPEVDWFFEERLVAQLQMMEGRSLYLERNNGSAATMAADQPPRYSVEYKVVALGIEYRQTASDPATGRGELVRRGVAGFFLRVIDDSSGRILLSEQVNGSRSDLVASETRRELENRNIAFTRGVFRGEGDNKALEALLVTGVSGVIVFLFYSLRSR